MNWKVPGALELKAPVICAAAGAGPATPTGISCGRGSRIAVPISPSNVTRTTSPAAIGAATVSIACVGSFIEFPPASDANSSCVEFYK